MITLVETLNYRSLRYAHRPLRPFHVLVGPNASGKTTFLDVIGFLRDVVSDGLDRALAERTPNPQDLLFRRRGDRLELAVEARIPNGLRHSTMKPDLDTVRYQVALGVDQTQRRFEFKAETLMLKKTTPASNAPQPSFPSIRPRPDSLQISIRQRNNKVVINKAPGGNDNFYNEAKRPDEGWAPSFRLGPRKSALGNLPVDAFPGGAERRPAGRRALFRQGRRRVHRHGARIRTSHAPAMARRCGSGHAACRGRPGMTRKDLVILAADKDLEHALQGLLARPRALDIRPIAFDVFVHPRHDAACAREAFHAALHEARVARSASLYRRLAERVSVQRCADRAFQDLRSTLRHWFPPRPA